MGLGFTLALVIIASIRESLGAGKIFGFNLITGFEPVTMMILAPGALLTLGLLIALVNFWHIKRKTNREIKHLACQKKGCDGDGCR